jgi:hypothetical protein
MHLNDMDIHSTSDAEPIIYVYILNSFYLISSPFSSRLLSFGSGGTFATHGFILDPPTDKVQDPQSPLKKNHKDES